MMWQLTQHRNLIVCLWLLLAVAASVSTNVAFAEEIHDDDDCGTGSCPNSSPTKKQQNQKDQESSCGLWLGPSPIKNAEDHGFGLGMFTGKDIKQGQTIESVFYQADQPHYVGEVLLPILGSQDIMEQHNPIREVLWDEENLPAVAVEYPDTITAFFMPGLAAITPCTSLNYNLKLVGKGDAAENLKSDNKKSFGSSSSSWQAVENDVKLAPHRSSSTATAGSWSYRQGIQYMAVRDISAGEELTVECDDDGYDGGQYFLSRYSNNDDGSSLTQCLDRTVQVAPSVIPGAGRGLQAKTRLRKDEKILSTPLVPVLRKDLEIKGSGGKSNNVNDQQLLLNYCYGHADSDLLLLPVGPLVNYLNHAGGNANSSNDNNKTKNLTPNAKIVWHQTSLKEQSAALERRQEYHHYDEMKSWTAKRVAETHGMGLVMDIVAARPIAQGEEILLDYGEAWQQAWEEHVQEYHEALEEGDMDSNYISAEAYVQRHKEQKGDNLSPLIRTSTEQARDPYPKNINLYCFYAQQVFMEDPETELDDDQFIDDGSAAYIDWHDDDFHSCFRPCRILERTHDEEKGNHADETYTVELSLIHNPMILSRCLIRQDMIVTHVPASAVRLVDKPYTTDTLLPQAFRHEIAVPSDFYPPSWMRNYRSGVRGGTGKSGVLCNGGDCQGDEFKRKKSNENLPTKPQMGVTPLGEMIQPQEEG